MFSRIRSLFFFLFACSAYADSQSPNFYSSKCPFEVDVSAAFDDFRSIPQGSWYGNWGAYASANVKTFLSCEWSLQLAGSYGIYDWYGRACPFCNDSLQQQEFVTIATSREVLSSGINVGFAYDWTFNQNFGLFSVNPSFDQIRAQLGYLISGGNELGAWGAYGPNTSNKRSHGVSLKFRGISQVNLFWCHYFQNFGYGMIWAGTPLRRGLLYESGRPGQFLVGVQFAAPMTQSLSIEGHGVYMAPRGGTSSAKNYASNLSIALTYSFGKRRIQKSPYMTLANNSNFLADTNHNF